MIIRNDTVFANYDVRTHRGENLHLHLVTVAIFRGVTKRLSRRLPRLLLGHHGGWSSTRGAVAPTMGGFLVNFLCKENWNNGVSDAKSKEGNVALPALRGFGLSLTQRRNQSPYLALPSSTPEVYSPSAHLRGFFFKDAVITSSQTQFWYLLYLTLFYGLYIVFTKTKISPRLYHLTRM